MVKGLWQNRVGSPGEALSAIRVGFPAETGEGPPPWASPREPGLCCGNARFYLTGHGRAQAGGVHRHASGSCTAVSLVVF